MRKKPKWWALILALILLAGSGFTAYKFHGMYGRYGDFNMHGIRSKIDMRWDDDRSKFGHKSMMNDWDEDWDDDWDEDWHRGKGHGRSFQYKMSDEDLSKTPDVYAKEMAEKSFGDQVEVKPLDLAEEGVVAYQVIKENKLVQILIIDTEENITSFMYR